MARQTAARSAAQQPETVRQPGGDLLDGQQAYARRRQLYRERDPVELGAHRGEGSRTGLREREVGPDLQRASEEEPCRVGSREVLGGPATPVFWSGTRPNYADLAA